MNLRFGGNDYLDLARHPAVVEAAAAAARAHGASTCASRVSVGTIALHRELEGALASFLGCEEAAVLSSGFLAAAAAYDALRPEPGSGGALAAAVDAACHPSLLLGARAAGAAIERYRFFDAGGLEAALGRLAGAAEGGAASAVPPRLAAATDGVEGFAGLIAPLDRLAAAARGRGAALLIDDAHGIGILGPEGRGAAAELGIAAGEVEVILVGSLGKALGSSGGFAAGRREAMARLRAGPAYTGSTALSPPAAAAALAALRIARAEPERRRRLLALGRRLRAGLIDLRAPLAAGSAAGSIAAAPAPVFPVSTLEFPDAAAAARIAAALEERRIEVAHFAYATAGSSARLRLPLSARHREEDIDRLLAAFEEIL